MTKRAPIPDKQWSDNAKQFWRDVHKRFLLEPHHVATLSQCCWLLTRIDQAREVLRKEGVCCADRLGNPREHPMLGAERTSTNLFRLCVRELGLDASEAAEAAEQNRIPRTKEYA